MKIPLWLLLSLVTCLSPVAHAKSRIAREDDVREVLLRRLAPNQGVALKQTTKRSEFEPPEIKVYYFSYWNKGSFQDPSDHFLKRFSANRPPIKKESQSYVDPNAKDYDWSYLKDKKTKELGMRFWVGPIRWLSRSQVRAQAGYAAGGLNAGRNDYWLRFRNGHWKIIKVKYGPVS